MSILTLVYNVFRKEKQFFPQHWYNTRNLPFAVRVIITGSGLVSGHHGIDPGQHSEDIHTLGIIFKHPRQWLDKPGSIDRISPWVVSWDSGVSVDEISFSWDRHFIVLWSISDIHTIHVLMTLKLQKKNKLDLKIDKKRPCYVHGEEWKFMFSLTNTALLYHEDSLGFGHYQSSYLSFFSHFDSFQSNKKELNQS